MIMLTWWLHTLPSAYTWGRQKQAVRDKSKDQCLHLPSALPHPSGTACGAAVTHFKAKMWCHSKVCGAKFITWSTAKWKTHYRGQHMQRAVQMGLRQCRLCLEQPFVGLEPGGMAAAAQQHPDASCLACSGPCACASHCCSHHVQRGKRKFPSTASSPQWNQTCPPIPQLQSMTWGK